VPTWPGMSARLRLPARVTPRPDRSRRGHRRLIRHLLGVLAACALLAALDACRSPEHGQPGMSTSTDVPSPPVRDPSVLVLVHSFTGQTATVGQELAEMLGGRFIRVSDPPPIPDVTPIAGPRLAEALPAIGMAGVRRLYLGFPIYDEAPSPVAGEIVRSLPLDGVRVTPFFTYVHYVDPGSLAALATAISARGGEPTVPIALRLPAMVSHGDILARTRRAVLDRRDLWAVDPERPAQVDCAELPAPHSARLCSVPAGSVWIGEVSGDDPDVSANPPRLLHVDGFDLDEQEITIAQYQRCVASQRCRKREPHGVSAELERGGDDLPMPDLSWSDAAAYCAFVGLRLPTEPEWVRAARGGGLDSYPWGETPPGVGPPRANLGEKPEHGISHYALAAPDSDWEGDGVAGLAPGCHFPLGRGPYGHCDLIGNLLEWVDGPTPMSKGGSWIDVEPHSATIAGRAEQWRLGAYLNGARCARSK
jgi:formylglycine-generating enzyme required for sulfatase activity